MSNLSDIESGDWVRTCLTLLFLSFLCSCGRAQNLPSDQAIYEIPHRKLTVRQGLTRDQLLHVWQDRDGFVWLAGKQGVDRFDGLEILSYQNDTNAIREYVLDVDEDDDGTLWFFGIKTDYRYDGGLMQGRERETINNRTNLQRINGRTYRFETKTGKANVIIPAAYDPAWPKNGYLPPYLPLSIKDTENEVAYIARHPNQADTLFFQEDFPYGPVRLLAVSDRITGIKDASSQQFQQFLIADSLFQLTNGQLLFLRTAPGIHKNLRILNAQGAIFLRNMLAVTEPESNRPVLYANKYLLSNVFQRNDRMFIVGEQGVVTLRPRDALTIYPVEKGMVQNVWSLVGAAAGAKNGSEGAMFFFPFTERSVLRLKGGRYERLPGLVGPKDRYFYPGAIRRANGHFLVPTNARVYDFDPVSSELNPLDGPGRRATNELLEVGSTIYAATNGLAVYENDRLEKVYGQDEGLDVDEFGFFETVAQDRAGRLWLGAHLGLSVRETDGSFHNYYIDQEIPAGIVDIKTDHRGNLWMATHRGVAFHHYSDSLPRWIDPAFTEDVKFVQPIGKDYILLGGTNKLFFLDLKAFYRGETNIYPYDEDDGFPAAECLQSAVFQDDAGVVWIGTTESVIKLEPDKLVFHRQPTDPQFLSFSYLNPLIKEEVIRRIPFNENDRQHFTISSTDQQIDIRFFTINHDKPKGITYQYRLLGYRDDWSRPQATRYAEFGELPPGDYSFELRACLFENCTEAKTLEITVEPGRWYEYAAIPWLAGLLLLLPFALIAYQWRRRRQAVAAQQKSEVDRLQLYRRLTQHKIGPHFANNALNAISSLIINNENERALRYTGRFARLFRPVLEDGLPLLRSLSEELDFIRDYLKLEKLRFPQKLGYRIEMSEEVRTLADRVLVPTLLIQSFVNNAVKHGIEPLREGGELTINLRLQDENYLLVEITDNGPGYFVEGETSGTGIQGALEILRYLDEHHQSTSTIDFSLKDPLQTSSGTVVQLHLYLHYQTLD
jgi:hypothetical protein